MSTLRQRYAEVDAKYMVISAERLRLANAIKNQEHAEATQRLKAMAALPPVWAFKWPQYDALLDQSRTLRLKTESVHVPGVVSDVHWGTESNGEKWCEATVTRPMSSDVSAMFATLPTTTFIFHDVYEPAHKSAWIPDTSNTVTLEPKYDDGPTRQRELSSVAFVLSKTSVVARSSEDDWEF